MLSFFLFVFYTVRQIILSFYRILVLNPKKTKGVELKTKLLRISKYLKIYEQKKHQSANIISYTLFRRTIKNHMTPFCKEYLLSKASIADRCHFICLNNISTAYAENARAPPYFLSEAHSN